MSARSHWWFSLQRQLDALEKAATVVRPPSGGYKISEQALAQLEEGLRGAEALEAAAEGRFRELVAAKCPALSDTNVWQKFLDAFLIPLVTHLGANTYNLITKKALTQDAPFFTVLSDQFGEANGLAMREIAAAFLDPADRIVREFVLRLMNTFFFVQASSLDAKTVKELSSNGTKFSATIFADTNFIFSLLGLHDNPADEAALALVAMIKELSCTYKIRLYILPPTIDETTRVITKAQEAALRLRLPQNVVEVAFENATLSVTQKFLKLVAASKTPINAREYFGPFMRNLVAILKSKGVELFNQDLTQYKKRQDVVDDLLDRLTFEKARYGARAKTYEELEHDCVMWHFVKDKRPVRTESPLEAGYWVVTVDYRYLGFDSFLNRTAEGAIPVCLHPAMLTQMLQFWVPRTAEFETALLSAMRLPLLFQEFDSSAEIVTIQILEALSRFENIGDLPKETVKAILVNDALRLRIASEHDITKQIELIREAVIEENKNVTLRLKDADEKTVILAQQMASQKAKIEALNDTVSAQAKELQGAQDLAATLKSELSSLKDSHAIEEARRIFVLKFGLVPTIAAILVTLVIGSAIAPLGSGKFWFFAVCVWTLCLASLLWFVDRRGSKSEAVLSWPPYQRLHRLRAFLFSVLLLPTLGRAFWEAGKALYERYGH